MHLGFTLPAFLDGNSSRRLREIANAIEDNGFDHVLVLDHVLGAELKNRPDWTGPYSNADPFHEPLVVLAYFSAISSLELVSSVLILPQRQTALVAKQAAEVNLLSGGRLRLGVGMGWNDVEYEALGVDFASRGERLEEQVGLLRDLWTHKSVTFRGTYDVVTEAGLVPLPERPPPVWLGGGSNQRTLERIGRIADGWMVPRLAPGRGFEQARDVVLASVLASGRDPSQFGMEGGVRIASDFKADSLVKSAARWEEAGISHLQIIAADSQLSFVDCMGMIGTSARALARLRS